VTATWPPFDVCIGNPPYLGARNIREEKSAEEVAAIRRAYPDIGGLSDYVSYWFRKTQDARRGSRGSGRDRQRPLRRHAGEHPGLHRR
jgi:hypothetical protein